MPRREVMWPRLIASKLLKKQVGRNNFVADFPSSEAEAEADAAETWLHLRPPRQLGKIKCLSSQSILSDYHVEETQNYKVFVSTWNLGGVAPTKALDIDDWLDMCNHPCDIYVFGFQEVVPLKASSVFGSENSDIIKQWNSIIRAALNKQWSRSSIIHEDESSKLENESESELDGQFKCIVSKQMVGILITVWIRSDLRSFVRNPSVSCVGCGIMGCLGNKGSVSVRFRLHETSFCFVCSHLASGCKGGDEKHRNSNAAEILSRTTFPKGPFHDFPRKILDHDRVVWLGDLNYRISLPEWSTRLLVDKGEWNALLQNDQLKTELMGGQVFEGWHEGTIQFPPTYKYCLNSDQYYGHGHAHPYYQTNKEKKRSPAWCDRIIWFGEEIKQEIYARGESKLSDHRPVKSIFSTKVRISTNSKEMKSYFLSERFAMTRTKEEDDVYSSDDF